LHSTVRQEVGEKHSRDVIADRKTRLKELAGDRFREEMLAAGWRTLREAQREVEREDCVAVRTLVRIVEGQITWREKETADQHMSRCLACIDRWTNLQEMRMYYSRPMAPADEFIDRVIAKMGFPVERKKQSLLQNVDRMIKR
jgi:hypothetical protein